MKIVVKLDISIIGMFKIEAGASSPIIWEGAVRCCRRVMRGYNSETSMDPSIHETLLRHFFLDLDPSIHETLLRHFFLDLDPSIYVVTLYQIVGGGWFLPE